MVERARLLPPDAELSRPALVLAQRFVQRWDLHARQMDDGSYVCIHEQLNVGHLLAHLRGEITLGAYLLDQESQARSIVLDADDEHGWERLSQLARMLADEDVPAYLEKSRRGGHLWLFLAGAVAGREARAFGHGLLAAHQVEGVELFPKQDQLADGPGPLSPINRPRRRTIPFSHWPAALNIHPPFSSRQRASPSSKTSAISSGAYPSVRASSRAERTIARSFPRRMRATCTSSGTPATKVPRPRWVEMTPSRSRSR
jgi:hypothetical protein